MSVRSESISLSQAAEILGENESTLRRWVQQRTLEGALIAGDNDQQKEQGVTTQSLERVQRVLISGSRQGR